MEEIEFTETSVIIHNLEIKRADLLKYLQGFDSPGDGFKELIDIAMTVRSRFTTGLETQNIKDSAQGVIEQMDKIFEQLVKVVHIPSRIVIARVLLACCNFSLCGGKSRLSKAVIP